MNVKIQVGFITLKSLILINGVHNHETFFTHIRELIT